MVLPILIMIVSWTTLIIKIVASAIESYNARHTEEYDEEYVELEEKFVSQKRSIADVKHNNIFKVEETAQTEIKREVRKLW